VTDMALHITCLAYALMLPVRPAPDPWRAAEQGRQLLEAASRLLEESRGSLGAVQVAAAVSAAGLTAAMPDQPADALPKLAVPSRSFELRPDEPLQQEASTPRFARGAELSAAPGQPGDEPVQVRVRALARIPSRLSREVLRGISPCLLHR